MGKQPFRVAFVGVHHDRHKHRLAALSPFILPQSYRGWGELERQISVFQPELVVVLPGAGPSPSFVAPATLAWSEADLDLAPEVLERRLLENTQSVEPQSRLLGWSPAMARVRGELRTIADSEFPILLTGESGTGKDLAATVAHELSVRAGQSLVAVNCGAIPPGLAETEFFGSVKGAFTGAESRPGLCQQACGGTLFLDEVGELPAETQAKLLRVLQNKEIRRVGSNHVEVADFRLICATNRDLAAEVRRGRFREDLYYRIYVLPLRMPALRDRKEDLPLLAQHFLKSRELGSRNNVVLSPDALAKLAEYHWPGNLRQLHNVLIRAAVLCAGPVIHPADISWD
jgi:transcriptional regulator with GAF, ATPase, and Fis domain